MIIKINYTVSDVNISTDASPIYVKIGAIDDSGVYVPYHGASDNVDLGEYGLKAGYFQVDVTPTNTPTDQGTFYWDDAAETLALVMNGTIQKVGEDVFFHVKNQSGSSIPKGTAVMFAGTDGNSGKMLIAPFLADGTYPSQYFMGVTSEVIANGDEGKVFHFGKMRGINTSAYQDGDLLYASTTVAGGFQTAVPTAPNNIVLIAAVINAANNGVIMIRPSIGSNINNDEGVRITNPTNGQVLKYNSTSGLWENGTDAGGVTGSGTTNVVPKFTSATSIGDSNIVLSETASTWTATIGSNLITSKDNNILDLRAYTEPRLRLSSGGGWVTTLFNSFGNVGLLTSNTSPSIFNYLLYYDYGSPTNKSLAFQTEGLNRLVLNQNGTIRMNNYITDGFVKFSNSNGTLTVDTTSYQPLLTNPITGTGASGQVSYWSGTNTQTGSNNLFWDNANGRLGIGTNSPASLIDVVGTPLAEISSRVSSDTPTGAGSFLVRKSRGTISSPTALQTGDRLGAFIFSGYNGTSFVNPTAIIGFAAENLTGSANGGYFGFETTANGSTTRSEKLRILGSGNVIIQNGGTFTDAGFRLDVNGTARVQGKLSVNTPSAASAVFEVTSTTQGVLFPRMTSTQIDAISTPAVGLTIFNTTEGYTEYYDSFWGWMPVSINQEWQNKNGSYVYDSLINQVSIYKSRVGGAGSLISNQNFQSGANILGYNGCTSLRTGTTSTGYATLHTQDGGSSAGIYIGYGNIKHQIQLALQNLSDATDEYIIISGFNNGSVVSAGQTSGVFFTYDRTGASNGTTAQTNWQVVTRNASTSTVTTTSVAVSTGTRYNLEIRINANATSVEFLINGVSVATHTTNIPSNTTSQRLQTGVFKTAGTNSREILVANSVYQMKYTTRLY